MEEKRKRLSELFMRMLSLYNLVDRNKRLVACDSQKLNFPILLFQETAPRVRIYMENKVLRIMSQKKLHLSADLDILV